MISSDYEQSGVVATVSQPSFPIPADTVTMATQGGIAVATILSVSYLIRWLVRLVEVSRKADND